MTAITGRPTVEEALAVCDGVLRYHAERLARRHRELTADDLYQVGVVAVIEYVRSGRYDESRGKLVTILGLRAFGEMLDEMRRRSFLPRTEVRRLRAAGETWPAVINFRQVKPFAGQWGETDERAVRYDPAHHDAEPSDGAEAEVEAVALSYCRGLSETERCILRWYFARGLKLKEIGERLEVSESRVSQMLKAILERLRGKATERLATAPACRVDEPPQSLATTCEAAGLSLVWYTRPHRGEQHGRVGIRCPHCGGVRSACPPAVRRWVASGVPECHQSGKYRCIPQAERPA